MPAVTRLVSITFRVGELAFAATVAGLVGQHIHGFQVTHSWPEKRFIYTETAAGLSMFLALIWLLPATWNFIHYPTDCLIFVLWTIAFGLLVNFIGPLHCGSIWAWGDITTGRGTCERWKAAVAFSFLSALFWLASALLGLWFVHRAASKTGAPGRKWWRPVRV